MRFKFGPIDFTQPSTWRGILGTAGVFGLAFSPELSQQIAIALGAALSAIEIFRNEYAARNTPLLPLELPTHPAASAPALAVRLRQSVPTDTKTAHHLDPQPPGFGDR